MSHSTEAGQQPGKTHFTVDGKNILVTGVATRDSIAWHCAEALAGAGANVAVACQARVQGIVEKLMRRKGIAGEPQIFDASLEGDTENLVARAGSYFGQLDCILHALAYGRKEAMEGRISDVTLGDYNLSAQISAYSLIEMVRGARPYLHAGSVVAALTFPPASENVMEDYGLVGPVKASLDALVRYLNLDLGRHKQGCVVAVAPTAVMTPASKGIGRISYYITAMDDNAPQGHVGQPDIAEVVLGLFGGMARCMGGHQIFVDNGGFTLGGLDVKTGAEAQSPE